MANLKKIFVALCFFLTATPALQSGECRTAPSVGKASTKVTGIISYQGKGFEVSRSQGSGFYCQQKGKWSWYWLLNRDGTGIQQRSVCSSRGVVCKKYTWDQTMGKNKILQWGFVTNGPFKGDILIKYRSGAGKYHAVPEKFISGLFRAKATYQPNGLPPSGSSPGTCEP